MFIEPLLTTIRAPAERNVSGDEWKIEHVSLLWSDEESFEDRAFYKHFVPTGRGSCVRRTLSESKKLRTCLRPLNAGIWSLSLAVMKLRLSNVKRHDCLEVAEVE
jgi:hypothetical protein